jgi:predicted membrane channel-forming protein YqfA (hemolysin III family)
MASARFFDIVMTASVAIVPIALILRWNMIGVFLGVLVVWWGLYIAGVVLDRLDPERDGAMLGAVWLYLGWLGGLLYCLPIYGTKRLYLWFRTQRRT